MGVGARRGRSRRIGGSIARTISATTRRRRYWRHAPRAERLDGPRAAARGRDPTSSCRSSRTTRRSRSAPVRAAAPGRARAPPAVDAVPWTAIHDIPTALVTGQQRQDHDGPVAGGHGRRRGRDARLLLDRGRVRRRASRSRSAIIRDRRARAACCVTRTFKSPILETARGGILRRGLAVERADVAVVTNIRADHFGEYGIENADDLAETKLVVARAVCRGGTLVLNADDATLMTAAEAPAACARLAAGALRVRLWTSRAGGAARAGRQHLRRPRRRVGAASLG